MVPGGTKVSDELNRQILEELKQINVRLDSIEAKKGLSTPMKLVAAFLGFTLVGPLLFLVFKIVLRI